MMIPKIILLIALYLVQSLSNNSHELQRILHKVPKVELHAHLHGSIRLTTLQELSDIANITLDIHGELNLEKCFKLFAAVHDIVSTITIVERIVYEVIEDYMAENTIYLELRTTPRNLPDGTTAEVYVEKLVDIIQQHNLQYGEKMLVKLILSIDRSIRFRDAIEISELVADFRFLSNSTEHPVRTIVGLDFSGNPYGGKFEDFSPLFDTAKDCGLGLTVHTAEVRELSDSVDSRTEEDDTKSILNFRPDRIGHVLFLQQHHLDQMLELLAKNEAPPIEVCPTSNLITLGHREYDEHPYLAQWLALGYPLSINTDDRGIFNTTLTEELLRVMDAQRLDLADMVQIIGGSIDQSFATPAEKLRLRSIYWETINRIVQEESTTGTAPAEKRGVGDGSGALHLIKSATEPRKTANVKDMQDMAYLLYI